MAMYHGAAHNSSNSKDQLPKNMTIAGVINIVGGGTNCFSLYQYLMNHKHPFWKKVGQTLVSDHSRAEELMAAICPSQHFNAGDPPVFLAHGERDEFGSSAQYQKIEATLKEFGTSVERISYPNSGHTFIQSDWEDLFPRVISFIARHGK